MVKLFCDAVEAYNPQWDRNEADDSVRFLQDILNALTLVTDESTPRVPGHLSTQDLNDKTHRQIESNEGQPPLNTDCIDRWNAYTQEGRTSTVFGCFGSQIVSECVCDTVDDGSLCEQVGRRSSALPCRLRISC